MERAMMRMLVWVALMLGASGMAVAGTGLNGDWVSPTGSVIRVYGCGQEVCAKIVKIEASAPGTVDENNPDAALRGRSLCELEIGQGFKREDESHASGGRLYDPKSGKTYSGTMVAEGDKLKLRGYIGVAMFGRTETWKRVSGDVGVCKV